jgi:hypothetical protein
MSKLILSDELRAQVNGDDSPSEVCDASANLIGCLVSPRRYAQYLDAHEKKMRRLISTNSIGLHKKKRATH